MAGARAQPGIAYETERPTTTDSEGGKPKGGAPGADGRALACEGSSKDRAASSTSKAAALRRAVPQCQTAGIGVVLIEAQRLAPIDDGDRES